MSTAGRIRWERILFGGFLAEVAVLAGVPELAAPMTPLDYVEALVGSFVSIFLLTLRVARPLERTRGAPDSAVDGAVVGMDGPAMVVS
jgi:hypothetical protein